MLTIFERFRIRPIAAATIAAIAGTMIAAPAAAQDGYYTDEAWWEIDEWFDGDDVSYQEYDDDYDDYGYDADDGWSSDDDDYAFDSDDDWSSDDDYGVYGYGYNNDWDTGWYETGYDDYGYWNDYELSPYDYDYYSNDWNDDDGVFGSWYDGWAYN